MIAAYGRVRERMRASDPEFTRFHGATRSTLACVLTAALCISWLVERHMPITLAALATLFAMIAPLFLRDRNRADWLVSLGLLYFCTCASFTLPALAASHPFVRGALLLSIVFMGMLCHALGPRAAGCALLALVAFYLGLYLHPSPHMLHAMLALSTLAPLVVAWVARVLPPPGDAAQARLAPALASRRRSRLAHALNRCKTRLQRDLDTLARHRHHLAWRPAVLATIAALLALLAGDEMSSERSMWAVISTFVVFLGTHSREGTVARVGKRLVGTLAGAAASVLLVALFKGARGADGLVCFRLGLLHPARLYARRILHYAAGWAGVWATRIRHRGARRTSCRRSRAGLPDCLCAVRVAHAVQHRSPGGGTAHLTLFLRDSANIPKILYAYTVDRIAMALPRAGKST